MKTTIFAKCLAVALAAGLTSFAGTAEAAIVSLDAPFTLDPNFGSKYLNFDGTSLTSSDSQGANSAQIQNAYGNLRFFITAATTNYAAAYDTNANGAFLTFSVNDVVSASSTNFYSNFQDSRFTGLNYYVLGFYNNQGIASSPGVSPNNDFIANSNLAWLAVSKDGNNNLTVEAAGINTVAGGSITVGDSGAPAAVPENDPATGGSALSLVAGVLAMIEQRRRRRGFAAGLTT